MTRKCPFCAEKIKWEAIKCKHCGEFLDEKSLQEAFVKKKTDRHVFDFEEVADYLRVPVDTINGWVKRKMMPFSKLPRNKGVVFKRKDIDKWITDNTITEYDKFVFSKKTIDDILPEGYKLPTDDEMVMDYIRELHEKWITKHCKKHGGNEVDHAKHLKNTFTGLTTKAGGKRIKFDWNFKKRKYEVVQGKEEYSKYLRRDEGFQGVLYEMTVLMQYLCACY